MKMVVGHLRHMLLTGAVVVGFLMALGVPWQQATRWALLLACPLMMLTMMRSRTGTHPSDTTLAPGRSERPAEIQQAGEPEDHQRHPAR